MKGDDFAGVLNDPLLFDRDDAPLVKLVAGCDCEFIPTSGLTTINSSMMIAEGTVEIKALVIGAGLGGKAKCTREDGIRTAYVSYFKDLVND